MIRTLPVALLFALFFAPVPSSARDREQDVSPALPAVATNPEADRIRAEADQSYQTGNYRRTVELANSLLTSFPTDNPHVAYHLRASAQIELGRQSRSAKLIRDGIADARQAVTVEGRRYGWLYIPYLYGLSSLADVEKRPEHATLALQVAGPLLQRPVGTEFTADTKAQLYYQRALAHTALGDLKSATTDYTAAIELSPEHLGAHIQRADALSAQNRIPEATKAFDEAVRVFPNALLVYNNRGTFRRKIGDRDGAVADFTRSLQIDPKFATGYLNRGLCLTEQNQPLAAEGDFTEALQLPIDSGTKVLAWRLRAVARVSHGNATDAVADYASALKVAPQDATLYEERGCARFFLKDFSGSAADFAKALQLNPQLSRVVPWLALSLARSEKSAESRAALANAETAKAAPPAWVGKLNAYLAERISEEELLAAATDTPPESGRNDRLCEAHFFIGQKKLLSASPEAAAEQFRQAVATQAFAVTAFRGARYEQADFGK